MFALVRAGYGFEEGQDIQGYDNKVCVKVMLVVKERAMGLCMRLLQSTNLSCPHDVQELDQYLESLIADYVAHGHLGGWNYLPADLQRTARGAMVRLFTLLLQPEVCSPNPFAQCRAPFKDYTQLTMKPAIVDSF